MGAILVGQALHGGLRPVGSTFFVFSDYMRPAIRLAALSHAERPLRLHPRLGGGGRGRSDPSAGRAPAWRCARCRGSTWCVLATRTRRSTCSGVTSPTRDPAAGAGPVASGRRGARRAPTPCFATGAQRGGYVVRRGRDDAVFTLVGTGSEVAHASRRRRARPARHRDARRGAAVLGVLRRAEPRVPRRRAAPRRAVGLARGRSHTGLDALRRRRARHRRLRPLGARPRGLRLTSGSTPTAWSRTYGGRVEARDAN